MARGEKAIFTNMCMIYDDKGNVLVQDRNDPDWPGVVFPGGHVELNEPFYTSVIREVKEETGLDIEKPQLCGVKQFPTEDGARYVVLLYKTNQFSGELKSSSEGEVFWIPREELKNYQLADSFRNMIDVFLNDDISEYFSYPVEDGSWEYELY